MNLFLIAFVNAVIELIDIALAVLKPITAWLSRMEDSLRRKKDET